MGKNTLIDVTLKNYRYFSDQKPARFSINDGFTAFIGVNNSRKSSLLRFFYEFRNLFQVMTNPNDIRLVALGGARAFGPAKTVLDIPEMFCNQNDRDIEIELQFDPNLDDDVDPNIPLAKRIVIRVVRDTNNFTAKVYFSDTASSQLPSDDLNLRDTHILTSHGNPIANLGPLIQMFQNLSDTLYIGSFRNAINIGTNEDYFDIRVGQGFIRESS